VDEVVIGSPTVITQDLLTTFNISLVRVHSLDHRFESQIKTQLKKRQRPAHHLQHLFGARTQNSQFKTQLKNSSKSSRDF